jgi:hypothetical protein
MTTTGLPYLGVPGSMRQLPSPNSPLTAPTSRNEVVHNLIGGGTVVTRRTGLPKRTFTLTYTSLFETDAALVAAFADGVFGDGPFVLVDPSTVNVLSLDRSTFGLRSGSSYGWSASAGSTSITTGQTAPTSVFSAVLDWASPTTSAVLLPGTSGTTADTTSAAVVLATEPATFSVYLKASGSCTCSLQLWSHDGTTGLQTASLGSASASVTTSWQQFTVTVSAGASGALLVPRVVLSSGSPAHIYAAAAQLEYAAPASTWQRGYGSPRVLVTQGTARSVTQLGYADQTLVLGEV